MILIEMMKDTIRKATLQQIDFLINHPKIHPSTGMKPGEIGTMKDFFNNPLNIGYVDKCGGMIFNHEEGSRFSGHFLFIPGYPAKQIKATAKAMLIQMFTKRNASVIVGYPPRDNRAVRVIGNALGYRKIDINEFTDEFGRICETYEVRLPWLV